MSNTPTTSPEPSLADGDVLDKQEALAPLARVPRFERLALVLAVGFQFLVLVTMILGQTVPFMGSKTILLKVVPVDPRDLFRGDYVILGYDISRATNAQFQPGEEVFVTLEPDADGRHYHAGLFLNSRPKGHLFIQGTAQSFGRVTYGIESYYVQEKTGHDYEAALRTGSLSAEIALDRNGRPALKGLVID